MGERIPLEAETTHIVFLNYSLCCLPSIDKMIEGVDEAWRLLIPQGLLVNFYPYISQSHLFTQLESGEQLKTHPMFEDRGFDDGYAFKNALILRGFELVTEEHITIKSFYRTKRKALEKILTGRSQKYLKLDHHLKYPISNVIGNFITTQEKPTWFPFRKEEDFTLICQILVKQSPWTKN